MEIKFHSPVILTDEFDKMKAFYQEIMQQEIEIDLGNCIIFKNGISLWKLTEDYLIAKKLGKTYNPEGNKNLELCFETDDYESVVAKLKNQDLKYLHETKEERWGQKTMRFYDPENNLIEIGETIPCFVKRFKTQGMTDKEVSERTSVPIEMVREICQEA
ncbi:VOC family protein [Marinilabilia salmonicolor]|uniref:Catechol 2,3-dioxygenase-like lactoylglutathione lyase family enzyme n=1 Tax=Marinilabilia salmonicolor TaxID=989 RepID=A0A368VD60_9BACT|nr:VOC family protein [Marinilabilia salmonicolor]RCW39046.1 catechol 2,3-dioxygenase-like lactoylglutathione lyase family enzyme [Marinilabilia salmonicolor]